jgi:hypothetical protein
MLGCLAIGALGLQRAYRATVRFYRGESSSRAKALAEPVRLRTVASPALNEQSRFLEMRLPGVSEHSAAVALASFRSFVRAPEVKMAWGLSLLAPVLTSAFFLRSADKIPDAAKPFIAIALIAFAIFLLVQFLANQFGFDRDGFRSLILFPTERRSILLGKNLACLPLTIGNSFLLLVFAEVWLRLPVLSALAAVFQLAAMALLALTAGNLLSILIPYRMSIGSLKPTKIPGEKMFVLAMFQMLFPFAMTPVFAAPLAELVWRKVGLSSAVPVNLLVSAGLAAVAAIVYWKLLSPFGRLLQRRETKILAAVATEHE